MTKKEYKFESNLEKRIKAEGISAKEKLLNLIKLKAYRTDNQIINDLMIELGKELDNDIEFAEWRLKELKSIYTEWEKISKNEVKTIIWG